MISQTWMVGRLRQYDARCAGGGDRRQSALPSRREQPDQAAHLCELHLPGRQLDAAAQGGGSARMLAAARCRATSSLRSRAPHSQRNRQSGAARAPHRRILADALRALSDPRDEPARPLRVRDAPRAPYQDRSARDRTYRAHSRPVTDKCPEGALFRAVALGLMPSGP
jgi:hypothetical protein